MPSMPEACVDDLKLSLAAEMLRDRGTIQIKAWGVSMLPSLWPGDLLTIQCAGHDDVVPGEIALVMRGNRFFIHRLVDRQQVQDRFLWITRGDAMPQNDAPVAAFELRGRVTSVRRAHRSFVPSRRLSLLHSALAGMLCRWDRFRNLALRIHAARLQAGPPRDWQCFRRVFSALTGTASISPSLPSRAFHP
jgi:hypothetical protein